MKRFFIPTLFSWLFLAGVAACTAFAAAPAVEVRRLPKGAMQPVAMTDGADTVHLVWLQGDPKASDVFYQALPGGRSDGPAPIRVNSKPGSALAIGTVRGASLAVAKNGEVHVVWNGSSSAEPESKQGAAVMYSRLVSGQKGFENQRNLLGKTANLDGGASVAADDAGRVFVVWHAQPNDDRGGEDKRGVYLAQSSDSGATFQPERVVSLENGVCGCCGLRAFAGAAGDLYVLYRGAYAETNRPMVLIASRDHARTFQPVLKSDWALGGCPMSTAASVVAPNFMAAAWETRKEIELVCEIGTATVLHTVSSGGASKHPALSRNSTGDMICAWAEGTGWAQGGSVAWRALNSKGEPAGEIVRQNGLPVWSFPAAYPRNDGSFVVVF